MRRLFLLMFLAVFLSGCSSISRNLSNLIFPPYPNSDQRKGEAVSLSFQYHTDVNNNEDRDNIRSGWQGCIDNNANQPHSFVIGGALGAAALTFAIQQAQQFLKDEAKRYSASYSAIGIGDHFYTGRGSTVHEPNPNDSTNTIEVFKPDLKKSCEKIVATDLKSMTLKRTVSGEDNKGNKASIPAMELTFDIDSSLDGTAFQIKPGKITVYKSKAKIAAIDFSRPLGFDLLAPWTIFNLNSPAELSLLRPQKVDVTVQISIMAVWVDNKEVGHSELIASREFKVSNLTLGTEKQIPQTDKQLFPAIPRSFFDKDKYGLGNFVVSVNVTEYDNFAERVQELDKGLEKNKDGIIKRFTDDI
ncbi:MAG: hypothetical protein MRK00_09815 [Nitrosomonas sp.]|nr:hypothetical protein [Nitrosomonas sp.]